MIEHDSSINVTAEQGANGSNGHHQQTVRAQFDEKLFHLIVESATEYAIFAIDLQGNIFTWNTGAERVFGYSEDQILGRDFTTLFTDEDRRAGIPRSEMRRALENGSAENERWHLRHDNTRFWATGKLMPLKNGDGEISGFVKICRDQTERRQAHNNLSSYEARFQEMIRQSPLSTFVQDVTGRVKYVNPAFTKLWGVTLEDLADYNALKDEQAEALGIKPYIERAFAGEAVEIPPVRYDPKQTASVGEGNVCWVKISAYPIKDENGQVLEVVTMHEDVSQKIKHEEELTRNEQRLTLAQEAGNIGSFDWDMVTGKVLWSPKLEAIFGLAPGGFAGSFKNCKNFLHPEDFARCDAEIAATLENKLPEWQSEFRILRADDGDTRWIEARTRIFYDENKLPVRMIGVGLDITERKRGEEESRRNRERFEALVQASSQIVWRTDVNGKVNADSPSWRAFTGQTYEEWLSNGWDAVHPDDREQSALAWEKAIRTQSFFETEYRVKHKSGEYRWTAVRGVPLHNVDGTIREWVGMNTDITEQKQAEQALRQSHARLEFVLESSEIGEWELDLTTGKAQRSFIHDQCFGAKKPFKEWSYDIFISYVHPDDRAEVERKFGESIREQKEWDFECRVVWEDGSLHWIHAKGNFYRDKDEKPTQMLGIVTEITEQKEAEEALRASEESFRAFVTTSSDVIYKMSADWSEMRSLDGKDFISDTEDPSNTWLEKYIPEEERAKVQAAIKEAIKNKSAFKLEHRVFRTDETIGWTHSRAIPMLDSKGEIIEWFGAASDVSEQKRAEEALHASEEFSRSVIASSPDCFKILNAEGRLQFMNENGLCLLEIDDFEPFRDQAWESLWEGEGQQQAAEAIKQAKTGQIARFQGFTPTAKDTPKWWDVIVAPVRGANGEIERLLSVSRDITQLKHAEQERERLLKREQAALKQSEMEREKLRSLFQQAPAIVNIQRGPDHTFELVHPMMYQLMGERDFIGKPMRETVPEAVDQGFIELLDNVYKTGEPYFGKETFAVLTAPDGSQREGYFDFIYHPWRDLDGNIAGIMTFAVEVTDRVLARKLMEKASAEREEMLTREQQLRQTAEEASRLKDEFLAIVSHELRTPLNAILGWSQMMRNKMIGPDRLDSAIETINRNAVSQAQLIDDLLDITRVITGKLRLNIRDVDLASIISSALQTVRPAAEAKNITLDAQIYSSPSVFSGDSERLQQVVWNLLSNAVKFTPKDGRVEVKLESKGSHYNITVTDTGEGIEPEFLPFVFDRFRQADMSPTRKQGGLGLGLSIVRHLVEMHGGGVHVESKGKGRGATFTVVLPLKTLQFEELAERSSRAGELQDQSTPTIRLEGKKILVVDDEPDTCLMLSVLLEECGATVRTVISVREALEAFVTSPPDVLISDIAMPEQDGYELIKRIRELPESEGGMVPAVALTAYASSEDRKKAIKAGFQSHVPKPVNQNALVTVLASLV